MARLIHEAICALPSAYGISVLKEFLHGSRTKKITDRHLEQISGYGSLEHLSAEEIADYLELLCADGYLCRSLDSFQTISCTDRLIRALNTGEPILINRLMSRAASQKARKDFSEFSKDEKELFEALRKTRMVLAIKNKVPPYIIFNDRTLRQMAQKSPSNSYELSQISGIGTQKLEKYGPVFLNAIERFKTEKQSGAAESASSETQDTSDQAK